MGIEHDEEIFKVQVDQPDGKGQEYIVRAVDTQTAIARFMSMMGLRDKTKAVSITTFTNDMLLGNVPTYFGLVGCEEYIIQRVQLDSWVAEWA